MEFEELKQFSDQPLEIDDIPEELNIQDKMTELRDKIKIKTKILHYYEKFPSELQSYSVKMNSLDELSHDDLILLAEEVKLVVNQRTSGGLIKSLYFTGAGFLEAMSMGFGFDLTGFKNKLQENSQVQKCLDMIALEYDDYATAPPQVMLAFCTLNAVTSVYENNLKDKVIKNETAKSIAPELADQYKDL